MYYNADLLEIPQQINHNMEDLSLGFIDDITYGVAGLTDEGNVDRLQTILTRVEQWRRRHGAQFEPSKYVLVHFIRKSRGNRQTNASITISGTTVQPSSEVKYLGVIFDKGLRFTSHLQYITKKGTKFALAMTSVGKQAWGPQYNHM
jgi:hypothetical protein